MKTSRETVDWLRPVWSKGDEELLQPEIGLDATHNTASLPERAEKSFFLVIPSYRTLRGVGLSEVGVAVAFLRKSVDGKLESTMMSEVSGNSDTSIPLGFWYRKLRWASVDSALKERSQATLAMAEALPRNLP
jgi:hypothetical protein